MMSYRYIVVAMIMRKHIYDFLTTSLLCVVLLCCSVSTYAVGVFVGKSEKSDTVEIAGNRVYYHIGDSKKFLYYDDKGKEVATVFRDTPSKRCYSQKVLYDLRPYGFGGDICIEVIYRIDTAFVFSPLVLEIDNAPQGKKPLFEVRQVSNAKGGISYDKDSQTIKLPLMIIKRGKPEHSKLFNFIMNK